MRPLNHRRRTMFALLTPLAACAGLAVVSGLSTSGCGGTDTIDDDASTDSTVDETAVDETGADTRRDTLADTGPDVTIDSAVDSSVDSTVDSSVDSITDSAPPLDASDTGDTNVVDVPLEVDVGDTLVADTRIDADADVLDVLDVRDVSDAPSPVPSLGAAATFAVLAGVTVTNTGLSTVNGDLGVSPGLAITGFPPGLVIGGSMYTGVGSRAEAAQASLTVLYNNLKGAACDTDMSGTDLSGLTLKPGVYCFSSSAAITTVGTLTLDAKGDPNAFWIFQIGSTFTTPDGAAVAVINGGSACNVFFQVGSSATIGKNNLFGGNIVAFSSISVSTGSTISGRALARNAAVTLDTNQVSFTTCLGGGLGDAGVDAADAADGDVGDVFDGTDVSEVDVTDGG